jgi:hypothetical protein
MTLNKVKDQHTNQIDLNEILKIDYTNILEKYTKE